MAGNRSRRLGMAYEDDYAISTVYVAETDTATAPIIEYVWRNVNNIEGLDFLVVQQRATLFFYDCSGSPISQNIKSFSVDLSAYYVAGYNAPEDVPVQMHSGKGYLFVVSSAIEPLLIEYSQLTDTITTQSIEILIRDFDGVEDSLAIDEEIASLSSEHKYNLQNQGWISDATVTSTSFGINGLARFSVKTTTSLVNVITKYKDVIGNYPANNKQWFLGKVEIEADGYKVGDFNPTLLNKVHVGNSRAPRGHYVFPAFNKDRSAVSGIPGLAVAQEASRPSTLCFASGRVFYGHSNNVYFSQILSEKGKAGLCFQDNDPTAEDLSDLLDNDGGVIPIPSADRIVLTKEVANGIMVFANNGVWFISGGEKGFSATDYQITKVASIGTDAPYSVVDTQNHIYYWSKTGIQRLEQQQGMFGATGSFNATNLTENTIDRLIKDIPSIIRKKVKGVFDYGSNTIHWLYAEASIGRDYFYNKFINFNTITESFFPWSLATNDDLPHIVGHFITSEINRVSGDIDVYIDSNEVLIGTDQVVIDSTTSSSKDTFIQYLIATPQETPGQWRFTIGNFTDENYEDWGTETYNSFIETGYEILDDAVRNKAIVYLSPFFRQTEQNYIEDGDGYAYDKPSSCFLTTKWDWSNSSSSNKWSSKIQAYRLTRIPLPDPTDLAINNGFTVVTTKNKVRGTGRSIQFRFECDEAGKNFDLLGWQVFYVGNTEA